MEMVPEQHKSKFWRFVNWSAIFKMNELTTQLAVEEDLGIRVLKSLTWKEQAERRCEEAVRSLPNKAKCLLEVTVTFTLPRITCTLTTCRHHPRKVHFELGTLPKCCQCHPTHEVWKSVYSKPASAKRQKKVISGHCNFANKLGSAVDEDIHSTENRKRYYICTGSSINITIRLTFAHGVCCVYVRIAKTKKLDFMIIWIGNETSLGQP